MRKKITEDAKKEMKNENTKPLKNIIKPIKNLRDEKQGYNSQMSQVPSEVSKEIELAGPKCSKVSPVSRNYFNVN